MKYPKPIYLQETTSTNSYLAAFCDHEPQANLTCVYSAYQTAGRGQRGNTWESEPGANLLFSFVVYPSSLKAEQQFLLSQVTALALADALSAHTDSISIKWPNDIYWRDRKLCGTLIENDWDGAYVSRSISGTGINLNQKRFVSNAPNPVSLTQITGLLYNPATILEQVMERTSWYYGLLEAGCTDEIAQQYKQMLYRKAGFHPYRDCKGRFIARIHDIEPSGRLVLEDEKGTLRKYLFKEVSFEL